MQDLRAEYLGPLAPWGLCWRCKQYAMTLRHLSRRVEWSEVGPNPVSNADHSRFSESATAQ